MSVAALTVTFIIPPVAALPRKSRLNISFILHHCRLCFRRHHGERRPAYVLAAGAADHRFSWLNGTEAKIKDPIINHLIDKVRIGTPSTQQLDQYKQGATPFGLRMSAPS